MSTSDKLDEYKIILSDYKNENVELKKELLKNSSSKELDGIKKKNKQMMRILENLHLECSMCVTAYPYIAEIIQNAILELNLS